MLCCGKQGHPAAIHRTAMNVKKIGVLSERNEIVGEIDPIVLSILNNLQASKKPGTWYTIAKALLPEEDAPKPMPVNCEARNMLFGPEPLTPLWREELIPRSDFDSLASALGIAKSHVRKLATFDELEKRFRHIENLPESPKTNDALQTLINILTCCEIPNEQLYTFLNGDHCKLVELKEKAHAEGRVEGRMSIRIPNAILKHQLKEPVSFTLPAFQRLDGEYVALVVFQRRLFLVTAPYLDSESANEAALQVKKLAYSEDHRLKRLRQQVEAAENAELQKGLQRRAIPQDVQRLVWARDDGKCVRCGSSENLQYDHIIPFAKGGGYTEANIQLLCKHCNLQKSDEIGF